MRRAQQEASLTKSRRFSLPAMAGLALLSLGLLSIVVTSVATAETRAQPNAAMVGKRAGSGAPAATFAKQTMNPTPSPGYPAESPRGTTLRPIRDTHTLPPYPSLSQHQKEQGTVTLAVTIGKDGSVTHAVVARSSGHPLLDARAASYVRDTWRWQPPTRNGKPVVATTKVKVVFNLRDAR
jgi:TonB family protein